MTFYHFCAAHMVSDVMQCGLTLGAYPLIGGSELQFIPKCQWLTAEPDPDKQSWATSRLIAYSRTAYRLTVKIPDSYKKKIVRAAGFVKELPVEHQGIVTDWDGSDKWYIFKGNIPPKWIVGCRKM